MIEYTHIERYGTDEVEGIEEGLVYVFPKLDGTNARLGWEDGLVAGSRKRILSLEKDNAGFLAWAMTQPFDQYFKKHPNHVLMGEYLVPHSLKTYRADAWGKFHIFDVHNGDNYLHYKDYIDDVDELAEHDEIEVIRPLALVENGDEETFYSYLEKNDYLMQDGRVGEGLVLKNYDFINKYGRQCYAKIVTRKFKEKHRKEMGATQVKGKKSIEREIAKKYTTKALCEKTLAKIENDGGFTSKRTLELLHRIYHDVVQEEGWEIVKEYKNPTINFKRLQASVFSEVKKYLEI